jgi:hypothetical protein
MECSAKDNYNVTDLFKTLLSLSKILPPEAAIETNGGPLKRRSSAYVSATSKGEFASAAHAVSADRDSHRFVRRSRSRPESITGSREVQLVPELEQQRRRSLRIRRQVQAQIEVRSRPLAGPCTFLMSSQSVSVSVDTRCMLATIFSQVDPPRVMNSALRLGILPICISHHTSSPQITETSSHPHPRLTRGFDLRRLKVSTFPPARSPQPFRPLSSPSRLNPKLRLKSVCGLLWQPKTNKNPLTRAKGKVLAAATMMTGRRRRLWIEL